MSNDTSGPWSVTGSLGRFGAWRLTPKLTVPCDMSLEDAKAKVDELNAMEAVRDAAPDLLGACNYALDHQENLGGKLYEMLKAAIATAEGGAK